jgi:Skp family chaperone for outer membrane proteins
MALSKIVVALLAGATLLTAAAAAAQPVKIGVINLARLEKESAVSARATELIKQEFEPRRLQAEELTRRAETARERFKTEQAKLSPTETRNREREVTDLLRKAEQTRTRFFEELEARKNEMRAKFFEEANVSIKAVAEAGKFDLIVQRAAFVRSTVDVTPLVLKEMAKRGGTLR